VLNEDAKRFLDENHQAIMVTVRPDGTAHVARVGCGVVDGKLWSSGNVSRVRTKHLRGNPNATLCVFAGRDRRWIGIEAAVTIHEGPDAPQKALELQRATGREPEDVDAFLKDMAAQQRIIYEFDPKRVYGSYEPGAENRATR